MIKISLKFLPKGPNNNTPSLFQIMAWRRSGDKPLSEPMMISWLTHICVTRPQWVLQPVTLLVIQGSCCVCAQPMRDDVTKGSLITHWMAYWGKYPLLQLTHLPLDKMAAILQTTFSNAVSWMKNFNFRLKFHWSFSLHEITSARLPCQT